MTAPTPSQNFLQEALHQRNRLSPSANPQARDRENKRPEVARMFAGSRMYRAELCFKNIIYLSTSTVDIVL